MQTNERGSLVAPLIIVIVLLVGSLGFGIWAFTQMQHYKTDTNQIVDSAVSVAVEKAKTDKDNEFAEKEKQPYRTYSGPSDFGSVSFNYPKTWSGYVPEKTQTSSEAVDGYFFPGVVPDVVGSANFALRLKITNRPYTDTLVTFTELQKSGAVKVSPFRLAKVPSVLGVKITGKIIGEKQGALVILPNRDKTLQVWTEGQQFQKDFTNSILPSLSFTP